jgi:teichuronic acid biosynthesis glycosyltransferase TuaG
MNKQTNLVSIITPSYNSEKFIKDMINSIVNQTYQNWELLITDDFSSDKTVDIVKYYADGDSRIKLFRLSKNSGAGIARNYSINNAQGKYIAFCDSDDLWKPDKLSKQIDFMILNNLSFTFSSYDVVNENGEFLKTVDCPQKLTFNKLTRNNYVGCLTAIYDTKKLGKLFMPESRKRQDWVLWLTILKKIKNTYGFKDSLAIYRDRSKSLSSNKFKLVRYNWLVFHENLGFNKFFSLILIFRFLFYYSLFKILKW